MYGGSVVLSIDRQTNKTNRCHRYHNAARRGGKTASRGWGVLFFKNALPASATTLHYVQLLVALHDPPSRRHGF